MKSFIFLLITSTYSLGQVASLPSDSVFPKAGTKIKIYSKQSNFKDNKIACIVYFTDKIMGFSRRKMKYAIEKIDSSYQCEFTIPPNSTSFVYYYIDENEDVYSNAQQLYGQPISDSQGIISPEAKAQFVYSYFLTSKDLSIDKKEYCKKWYESIFDKTPKLFEKFCFSYFETFDLSNKFQKRQLMLTLDSISNNENLNEDILHQLMISYQKLNEPKKSKNIFSRLIDEYPLSNYATQAQILPIQTLFHQNDNLDEKLNIYIKFVNDFNDRNELNAKKYIVATRVIFLDRLMQPMYNVGKYDEWLRYVEELAQKDAIVILIKKFVLHCATINSNFALAESLVDKCIEWTASELKVQMQQDEFGIDLQVQDKLRNEYADCLKIKGYLLLSAGRDQEAITFLKEATELSERKNSEVNKNYIKSLIKNHQYETAKVEIELMVKFGKINHEIKEYWKELVNRIPGTNPDFFSIQERITTDKRIEMMKKNMSKIQFADFTLADVNGIIVDSKKDRGKVIVIDFWATWCAPCVASMPALQQTIDKYAKDSTVVFYLINYKQTKDVIKNFLSKRTNSFHVLMDENGMTFDNLKVTALPTRFVIDSNGYIRFRSSGYNMNAEEYFQELSAMIEAIKY